MDTDCGGGIDRNRVGNAATSKKESAKNKKNRKKKLRKKKKAAAEAADVATAATGKEDEKSSNNGVAATAAATAAGVAAAPQSEEKSQSSSSSSSFSSSKLLGDSQRVPGKGRCAAFAVQLPSVCLMKPIQILPRHVAGLPVAYLLRRAIPVWLLELDPGTELSCFPLGHDYDSNGYKRPHGYWDKGTKTEGETEEVRSFFFHC